MARRLSHIVCGLVPLFFLLMVGTVAGGSPVASHQRTAGQHRDLIATGYDLVGEDGGVFVFNGNFYGSLPGLGIRVHNIVGIVPSADYRGYFLVGSDGGVFAFGDVTFAGSLPGIGVTPTLPIVGIVPTSDDRGYFLVGSDGGVFAFGDAQFEGSLPGIGARVNDVASIASTPDNQGYWVLEKSGQVSNFGTAPDLATDPVNGGPLPNFEGLPYYANITSTTTGQGYWVLDSYGGVWTYGDANWWGDATVQAAGGTGERPVSLVGTADNQGYWIVTVNGDVVPCGDAENFGSLPGIGVKPNLAIVGAVPT
ncbi:MAG TPA: hypothetical protein VKG43_11085 [Acidimicrobiales bacterium]|nr:hypothetical protein [Acidimicrobiales bacterium]